MGDQLNFLIWFMICTLIGVFGYISWASPLGNAGCTTGLIPCQLPAAENWMHQQFGTTTTDIQFATLIALFWIFGMGFVLPMIFLAVRYLRGISF